MSVDVNKTLPPLHVIRFPIKRFKSMMAKANSPAERAAIKSLLGVGGNYGKRRP